VIPGLGRLDSRRAAEILRRIFMSLPTGCAFRLWDGTEVNLGAGPPVCTAVIPSRDTFVRLMRDPSPLNFAEAYVEGNLDIEGDLFAAMDVANAIEEIRLSPADRLKLLVSLWRP
jgi:cyclopropane-fatty-acyl-phospholipid synthase